MSHLRHEELWEHLPSTTGPASVHLESCAECRTQLAQVQQARALLSHRGPPPPLDPIAARRIGAVLKEAAQKQREPRGWFRFGWALAAVAAAVLGIVAWSSSQLMPPAPQPIVKQAPVIAPPQQVVEHVAPPAPVVVPEVAPPAPRPKLLAKVTGAKKSNSQKSAELAEGAVVKTEAGGALWLALPDGSRAGLTGSSEVQLDTLEDQTLTMTLTRGNLLVVARHLPERLMTVKAGEVEIKDIGTRFLVSRDVNRVLVAVEEGVVEVNAPGSTLTLKAGRSAEWREGRLVEQAWAPTPPEPKQTKLASSPTPAAEAVALDAGVAVAAAPAPVYRNPDDEWTAPANLPKTGLANPPTQPPVVEHKATEEEEASVLSLAGLEQRLKKVTRAVKAPFAPIGSTMREQRARDVGRLADENNCVEALKRADEWLGERTTDSSDEPKWKRSVQVNQLRCYTRLKRDDDAKRLKEQLQ